MKKTFLICLILLCFVITNAQWQNQNAGFTGKTLGFYEFSIVDTNTVWAICYDGYGGLFGPNPTLDFTRTINGGTTWIPGVVGNDTSLAFSNISALSASEAWVAMHRFGSVNGGGGGLFHTTDAGVTWTQSNAGLIFNDSSYPNFVYFKDVLNGIAVGNANDGYFEIYKTNDGGATWIRTPQDNLPALPTSGGTGWFDGYAVVGETIWFGSTRSKMYKSIDFGTTWTVSNVSTIGADRVYEIAFNDDALHGVCHTRTSSGSTKLFATLDGGLTWTQRVTSTIPNWRRDRITSVPGTNVFVSTSTSAQSGSSYTTDYGLTWTLIESTTQKAACRFLNSTTGWSGGFFSDDPAIGNLDGIFKWDNSTSLNTLETQTNEKNIKLYPSPTDSSIYVEINNSLNNDLVVITIHGIDGKLVFEKNFHNFKNQQSIDITNLKEGIYFAQIKTNNGFANIKFIKKT